MTTRDLTLAQFYAALARHGITAHWRRRSLPYVLFGKSADTRLKRLLYDPRARRRTTLASILWTMARFSKDYNRDGTPKR